MRVPVWAYDLACGFWQTLGADERFPRELARLWVYPLTVQRLPGLTIASAQAWLATVAAGIDLGPDRPLHGCLVCMRGEATVFIDSDDARDEQRYTLAHEIAHFLRDVWRPRQRVERLLGPAADDVCDGVRAQTPEERLAAVLDGVPLALHVHLLPRDADGEPATVAIADAEDAADVLALELLAPAAHLAQAGADGWTTDALIDRLTRVYGLPCREAVRYAARLRPSPRRPNGWVQALRASV